MMTVFTGLFTCLYTHVASQPSLMRAWNGQENLVPPLLILEFIHILMQEHLPPPPQHDILQFVVGNLAEGTREIPGNWFLISLV